MAFNFKKEYKEFYLPRNKAQIADPRKIISKKCKIVIRYPIKKL